MNGSCENSLWMPGTKIRASPSLCGSSHYIREELSIKNVAKKSRTILRTLERKKEQTSHDPAKKELSPKNEIEYEIECPRCGYGIMTLQSEFDRFCYFCEECCFTLSLIH
jgi:hypothetical protein